MKKIILTSIILLCVANLYGQNIVKSDASVSSVDVYPSGVKLYMKAKAQLQKGQNRIEIPNIPNNINSQTLSAGISAPGVTIHSSTIEYDGQNVLTDSKILELQSQIDKTNYDIELCNLKMKTIDEQLATLKKQCNVKEGVNAPLDYITGLVATLGTQMNKLNSDRHDIFIQYNKLTESLNKLNSKLNERKSQINNLANKIVIIAETQQEVLAPIQTEFIAYNASWSPYYEVRIANKKCDIVTKAKIHQNTYLDWNNVKLNLISSNLQNNSAQLPIVRTEYIPVVVAPAPVKQAQKMNYAIGDSQLSAAQAPMQMLEVAVEEEYSPELIQQSNATMATETSTLNMQNFLATVPYTITNNSSIDLKLTSAETPFVIEYLIMPTISNSAYLVANLTTDGSYKNASANVYLDGTFIGVQNLAATQLASDSVHLVSKVSLGTDNSIVLKRTDKNYTKNNTQYFDRTSQIVNNKKETVAVKVVESYPISTENDVRVENLKISEGSSTGNFPGVINWVFTLQPNAKKEVNINYTVRDTRRR